MRDSKEFSITVYKTGEEGVHQTDIAIMCSPVALIAGLSEAILRINETVNDMNNLPKNFVWTMLAETVGDNLIKASEAK